MNTMTYNTMTEIERFIKEHAVRTGVFTLASGKTSNVYIDARLATMSPEGMVLIGNRGFDTIQAQGWTPDSVGGLTMGADPVAFAISHTSALRGVPIRAFSVRKNIKSHGTGKRIEGPFKTGDRVVIVEDVITTGHSALEAIEAIETAGAQILGVLAVVDRNEGGREAIGLKGYDVIALTTKERLLGS